MSTLIDHLATDRIRGGRLVLAYSIGAVFGIALAMVALLAAGTGLLGAAQRPSRPIQAKSAALAACSCRLPFGALAREAFFPYQVRR